MYHIVYLTTNIINNKIYVGVHSSNIKNDSYLGSGKLLKRAIKKYGTKNFKRITLHYCLEESHMLEIEAQIVDQWFIDRNDTYNITLGGSKPPSQKGKHISDKHKAQITLKLGGCKGRQWTDDERINHKLIMTSIMQDDMVREKCSLAKRGKEGNKHTSESKAKLSYAQRNLSPEQLQRKSETKLGNKNGMHGKKMYNNGTINLTCIPDQQPEGFILGRLFTTKTTASLALEQE